MRIAHFLARCGVASRRKSETIVADGRVTVNGLPVLDLGRQVEPGEDEVCLDGKSLQLPKTHLTLVVYKPREVVVTRTDPQERQTIYDLLPVTYAARSTELAYAGRLDFMTEGMQVLSTDGDLILKLTHPRHHVEKTYHLRTNVPLAEEQLEELRQGVSLEDGATQPCQVRSFGRAERQTYEIILREGKNRQIRRMIDVVGAKVAWLRRVAIGKLELGSLNLELGECAELTERHIEMMLSERKPKE